MPPLRVTCRAKVAATANLQQHGAKPAIVTASHQDADLDTAYDISTAAADEVSDDSMNVASLDEDDLSF
jgi:hypothetical protein